MNPRFNLSRIPDWAVLCFFFAVILLQAVPSLMQKSATFDEVLRQYPGYLHLAVGEYRIHTEHPPLIKMLAAAPLLFSDITLPAPPARWNDYTHARTAQRFLFRVNDGERLVFLGRLAVLPLTLLMAFFVYQWSKELFGRSAAGFSLFLLSFEPNVLAHGRLMNTDVPIACFSFAVIYFFSQMLREVRPQRVLMAGLFLGLALMTKFSAIWLVLVLLALGIFAAAGSAPIRFGGGRFFATATRRGQKLLLCLSALLLIGLVSYGALWGIYRFRYEGGVDSRYGYPVSWTDVLPRASPGREAVVWARETKILPEAYLHGVSLVSQKMGRLSFLNGEISDRGWYHYFLVSFLLKTPLPLILWLLLLPVALASARREMSLTNNPLRPDTLPLGATFAKIRIGVLCLLLPAVLYFGLALASRMNIGHRHLLPIYPCLFVLLGAVWVWAGRQRIFLKACFAALAVWYVASSVTIFPHYLAYFNELAGGPDNGHKYLVDSNLDWGQDLKGLKQYMEKNKIERVWLSYFGLASPDYYGIGYQYLPSLMMFQPRIGYPELLRARRLQPLKGIVAISATNLHGVYLPVLGLDRDYFEFYREQKPVAKIGYSIFIYRLG